ncbi:hypothetical protein H6G97_37650 [Nostoc flagelliforme FACHB-838]|uniref:Beta-lactamase n=1 Tax=Nostoc flagelliforme FACHB-838 TaxID=2692904 RepID=A0ABR8DZK4_9NOSO|nr:hypothetical protein [Nostoc flagelliforme]MBD2534864.1 hypothetical protein [Nostoc flagelliforme FACHB-838]
MSYDNTAKVDELFVQWDKPNSPGCAIAIIQNGQMIYQHGYGMANLEYNIPLIPILYEGAYNRENKLDKLK